MEKSPSMTGTNKHDNRDSLDFGTMNVSYLFKKMFIPTFLGMVCSSLVNITDGIFVGRGVGSDALAAVNMCAPMFMIATGLALMLGVGGSVVVSIHLSKHKVKAANINMTQAFTTLGILGLLLAAFPMVFPQLTFNLLGGTELLFPYMAHYMKWVAPTMFVFVLVCAGMFFIRLDGSPTYSMLCEAIPTLLNVVLDFIFIFPLKMGVEGAAFASAISMTVGFLMVMYYMLFRTKTLKFYKPKFSHTAIGLYLRNIGYMAKNGFPSMLGELAMSCVVLTGNICFVKYLGEDGVAAFSVGSFCLPIIFMIGNSIAQSAQPILSYNYGSSQTVRVHQMYRLELIVGVAGGIILTLLGMVLCRPLASLFLEPGTNANMLASAGLPFFSIGFLFTTLNLVQTGYYQSLERAGKASMVMLLRGFVFMIPAFFLLPHVVGTKGLWLAIPVTEFLTTLAILAMECIRKRSPVSAKTAASGSRTN